ncbi:MAG: hypothetical protein K0R00_125 [Herbinix sp.]|jgi:hypothetical protein|nr:hypothetical protein [Herbinix sp.]
MFFDKILTQLRSALSEIKEISSYLNNYVFFEHHDAMFESAEYGDLVAAYIIYKENDEEKEFLLHKGILVAYGADIKNLVTVDGTKQDIQKYVIIHDVSLREDRQIYLGQDYQTEDYNSKVIAKLYKSSANGLRH